MPVSRKHAEQADLRTQAAAKMEIDLQYVFFMPKPRAKGGSLRSVLAIWTAGWSAAEVERIRLLKPEIKALAREFGAKKIYMTQVHPHEQEKRETARRKMRGPKYRERQHLKQILKQTDSKDVEAVKRVWKGE